MKTSCHTLFLAALLFALPAEADAPDLELTVYNDNLALIKQCSEINLERGVQEYSFSGVPAKLLPSTVHFLSLSDPDGTHILEQNYRYDLLSREKLLERYRGREVKMEVDGMWRSVRLLQAGSPATGTAPPGRIVEIDGEIHIEGFILPALPEGLLLEPTLVWLLEAARRGKQRVELSYLTGGLSWQADYIAVVGQGDKLDLKGWVTLRNSCGRDFEGARLKLVAGDVHRVRERNTRIELKEVTFGIATAAKTDFEEEDFFEYNLYSLPRPVTVLDREAKQIELLSRQGITAERSYTFRSHSHQEDRQSRAVAVELGFSLPGGSRDEADLPKGIVRVYQADGSGQLQFAGEDRINHTPAGERVNLKLGQTFDLRGVRQVIDTKRLDEKRRELTVEVTLRNHKDEDVLIDILEETSRWKEWEIRSSSHEHEKLSASWLKFPVTVPADGEVTLGYTIRYY